MYIILFYLFVLEFCFWLFCIILLFLFCLEFYLGFIRLGHLCLSEHAEAWWLGWIFMANVSFPTHLNLFVFRFKKRLPHTISLFLTLVIRKICICIDLECHNVYTHSLCGCIQWSAEGLVLPSQSMQRQQKPLFLCCKVIFSIGKRKRKLGSSDTSINYSTQALCLRRHGNGWFCMFSLCKRNTWCVQCCQSWCPSHHLRKQNIMTFLLSHFSRPVSYLQWFAYTVYTHTHGLARTHTLKVLDRQLAITEPFQFSVLQGLDKSPLVIDFIFQFHSSFNSSSLLFSVLSLSLSLFFYIFSVLAYFRWNLNDMLTRYNFHTAYACSMVLRK